MRLPPEEAKHFLELHMGLVGWGARRLDPKSAIHDATTLRAASLNEIVDARDRVFDKPALLDAYVAENPDGLSAADLELVSAWRRFVRGNFVAERDLKRYTVLLDLKNPPTAYGVLSLNDEITDILPMIPMLVEAVLVPWRGAIVCDGLLRYQNVHLGPGIRRRVKEAYRQAKARGIVVSLPSTPAPGAPAEPKKASAEPKKASAGKKKVKRRGKPLDPKQAFVGRWRIVQMEAWDEDYFETDGPAFIEVEPRGLGSFKFGLVEGQIDCRFNIEGETSAMEFSWAGFDEDDAASGRGRAYIDESGEMRGRIFIHLGDDSEFVAKRVE
jgi:hypothetical protein